MSLEVSILKSVTEFFQDYPEELASLTRDDYKLIADALHKRQRCYIAGDRMFIHYGKLLTKFEKLYETSSDN